MTREKIPKIFEVYIVKRFPEQKSPNIYSECKDLFSFVHLSTGEKLFVYKCKLKNFQLILRICYEIHVSSI